MCEHEESEPDIYEDNDDPFGYIDNQWEHQKYLNTVRVLPRHLYKEGLEVACSIGVMTRVIAPYCQRLLSVDGSERAVELASQRCSDLKHVEFTRLQLPDEIARLPRFFDLITVSEVLYYLGPNELDETMERLISKLTVQGHLLVAHCIANFGMRHTGEDIHDRLPKLESSTRLKHLVSKSYPRYRVDLFEKKH